MILSLMVKIQPLLAPVEENCREARKVFYIKSHTACLVCPLNAVSFMFTSINIVIAAIVQLVEQSTNDTKSDASNPAATGSGKGKLQRGKKSFPIKSHGSIQVLNFPGFRYN
jgi:hypothetical protein